MNRWERRLWCWLMGHRLIVWQEFSSYARRIKCEHCGGDWAMNDKERAFLPWDASFAELYEMLGHKIRKP